MFVLVAPTCAMSLYEILGLPQPCGSVAGPTQEAIEAAAERCRELLKRECPPPQLESSIAYIDSIEAILATEEGRACYNSIVSSQHSSISPLRASLILKRISWFNMGANAAFGDSFLYNLRRLSERETAAHSLLAEEAGSGAPLELKCRWCSTPVAQKDVVSVMCKCDSRCGHIQCLQGFLSKHKRCPVCRHKLLRRQTISKYMFFNKDPKYVVN